MPVTAAAADPNATTTANIGLNWFVEHNANAGTDIQKSAPSTRINDSNFSHYDVSDVIRAPVYP